MWTAVGNNKRRKKNQGEMKRKKNLLFMGPRKADFSTQKFRHNHHHRNNKRKNKLRRGEMGRRRRRTCTWQFSLIPSSTHTHNFWLEYWERAIALRAPLLCVHGPRGEQRGRWPRLKTRANTRCSPAHPLLFILIEKRQLFTPKKKSIQKKVFSLL